ncbi:hypothetical protein LTR97_003887 [Elasticomyces elasticus]|uniref:Uncharacterized protein n=1 Tax=Elasticomyces elasticus TaxID=574655 RepID=A0AAN7W9L9_9PEZI|nr:hypothetical protein LTR97_003887 [Elasticomyces elasticus]
MATPHKQLADSYRDKFLVADARIFELEKQIADLSQTATEVKTEENITPQADIAALTERNQELEDTVASYGKWLDDFEKIAGVKTAELPEAFREQRAAFEARGHTNEDLVKVEKAVREEVNKIKADNKKLEKKLASVERKRDEALSEVQKQKAALAREKQNTKLVTFGHPANTVLTAVRDLTPASTPTTPVVPTSSIKKRKVNEDADDEERTITVNTRPAPETPVKKSSRMSAPMPMSSSSAQSPTQQRSAKRTPQGRFQLSARPKPPTALMERINPARRT